MGSFKRSPGDSSVLSRLRSTELSKAVVPEVFCLLTIDNSPLHTCLASKSVLISPATLVHGKAAWPSCWSHLFRLRREFMVWPHDLHVGHTYSACDASSWRGRMTFTLVMCAWACGFHSRQRERALQLRHSSATVRNVENGYSAFN